MSQLKSRHLSAADAELLPKQKPSEACGEISSLVVYEQGGHMQGLWQMTPGVIAQVPGQETVVILQGKAEVTLDKTGETFSLKAGDVFVLDSHETATWHVSETVRKFFVVNR